MQVKKNGININVQSFALQGVNSRLRLSFHSFFLKFLEKKEPSTEALRGRRFLENEVLSTVGEEVCQKKFLIFFGAYNMAYKKSFFWGGG